MSEMAVPISVLSNAVPAIRSDTYVGMLEPHTSPSVTVAVARTLTTIQGGCRSRSLGWWMPVRPGFCSRGSAI